MLLRWFGDAHGRHMLDDMSAFFDLRFQYFNEHLFAILDKNGIFEIAEMREQMFYSISICRFCCMP